MWGLGSMDLPGALRPGVCPRSVNQRALCRVHQGHRLFPSLLPAWLGAGTSDVLYLRPTLVEFVDWLRCSRPQNQFLGPAIHHRMARGLSARLITRCPRSFQADCRDLQRAGPTAAIALVDLNSRALGSHSASAPLPSLRPLESSRTPAEVSARPVGAEKGLSDTRVLNLVPPSANRRAAIGFVWTRPRDAVRSTVGASLECWLRSPFWSNPHRYDQVFEAAAGTEARTRPAE